MAGRELVVLVHGLWMPGASLWLLARRLRRCGFDPRIFSYDTTRADLRENAARLQAFLASLPPEATVHFVGHSLGGLIIRALFHHFPQQRPGRIVNLGTPHLGSHAATQFMRLVPFGRAMLGECVGQLLRGVPDNWSTPRQEVGVIAGDLALGLGQLFPGLPSPNDGTIAAAETRWSGCLDHLVLHVSHISMLASREVAHQTCHFLQHGRFQR